MVVIVGYAPLKDGMPDFTRAIRMPPLNPPAHEVWVPLQTPSPVVRTSTVKEALLYPHNDGLSSTASLDFEVLLAQLIEESFEAGSSEEVQIDFDLVGVETAKRLVAMYRSLLPKPEAPLLGSRAVVLPPMADSDIDDLSSPFWQLVKALLSEIPPEMDSLGMGVRRQVVAQILLSLAEKTERPPYPLIEYATRYAYLRESHWTSHSLCVVSDPARSVKLGHLCPSSAHLDELLDRHIAAKGE